MTALILMVQSGGGAARQLIDMLVKDGAWQPSIVTCWIGNHVVTDSIPLETLVPVRKFREHGIYTLASSRLRRYIDKQEAHHQVGLGETRAA